MPKSYKTNWVQWVQHFVQYWPLKSHIFGEICPCYEFARNNSRETESTRKCSGEPFYCANARVYINAVAGIAIVGVHCIFKIFSTFISHTLVAV